MLAEDHVAKATFHGNLNPVQGCWNLLKSIHNPIGFSEYLHRNFGLIAAFDMPALRRHRHRRHLFIVGPDYNRQVLRQTDSIRPSGLWSLDGPPGSALHAIQHNYLLKMYGDLHESIVQRANRPLARSRVEGHFERTKAIIQAETSQWPLGTALDLYDIALKLAQRVSFTLLFGEMDLVRLRQFGDLVFEYNRANWKALCFLLPLRVPGTPYYRAWETAEALRSHILDWVAEAAARSPEDDIVAAFAQVGSDRGGTIEVEQIIGGMVFYAMASFESMSSVTTWALVLLMLHPDIMRDLLDEISAARPFMDIDPTRLSSLQLLDAVVKEVLRLVPPTAVAQFRVFNRCEVGGYTLLPSDRIIMCPHMTHRLPEIYDAPKQFRPRRWFSIEPSQYAYLPFMAGPRRCPGSWFGTAFLKLALVAILSQFRIELERNVRVDWRFAGTTIPKRRIPVQLAKQDGVVKSQSACGSFFDLFEQPSMRNNEQSN